ncbi:glycosyltransferase family 4 protein [Falsiroseomonas sp. E2-1-a20]|uniref:glycosyltransferase family 4 protein n=1 Tax=Falsiroseomonas sp. E2-1-a20 TaxID=3239300 RepID=UPI003F346D7B
MIPRRVLMTVDAVGGVWRYGIDLCRSLNGAGVEVLLACLGPPPRADQVAELADLPRTRLRLLDGPLDWMAPDAAALAGVPALLEEQAQREGCDLLHLNLPSQAAGLRTGLPLVVVSHSCVVTWWQAMRGTALPAEWAWQQALNAEGLARADVVLAPSASHAAALRDAYGLTRTIGVAPNAAEPDPGPSPHGRFVFAAARWWDEGKNAALLDAAAAGMAWPVRAAGGCRGENGQHFVFRHAEALGSLSHGATRTLMRQAAIFASPSRYEPFGLAALEAAQAGAALVLADIPTYREIWSDAALLVDSANPDALAAAVNGLAQDPARREALTARCRARAGQFTAARQLLALLPAYAAAASSSASQAAE